MRVFPSNLPGGAAVLVFASTAAQVAIGHIADPPDTDQVATGPVATAHLGPSMPERFPSTSRRPPSPPVPFISRPPLLDHRVRRGGAARLSPLVGAPLPIYAACSSAGGLRQGPPQAPPAGVYGRVPLLAPSSGAQTPSHPARRTPLSPCSPHEQIGVKLLGLISLPPYYWLLLAIIGYY